MLDERLFPKAISGRKLNAQFPVFGVFLPRNHSLVSTASSLRDLCRELPAERKA